MEQGNKKFSIKSKMLNFSTFFNERLLELTI